MGEVTFVNVSSKYLRIEGGMQVELSTEDRIQKLYHYVAITLEF